MPRPDPEIRRWTSADGLTIVGDYYSAADPDAPLVILGHGGGQTRRSWRNVAPRLAQLGYTTIAYDLRGHGQSGWATEGGYTEASLVEDIAAICDALGRHDPILIGASAGGIAALTAIGLGRIQARGLCLIDIAPRTEMEGYHRIRAFMLAGMEGFATLHDAAVALAAYRNEAPRQNPANLAKVLTLGADGRYRWHWDPAFVAARHAEIATREARLNGFVAKLPCPVMLIRGGSSDMVSLEGAQAFMALAPRGRLVDIAGLGHMVTGDHSDVYLAAIRDFLSELAG